MTSLCLPEGWRLEEELLEEVRNSSLLIAYNDPPTFMDIMGSNGELILRAQIGTFEFIVATSMGSERRLVCHNLADVPYMTSVIPIRIIDNDNHELVHY